MFAVADRIQKFYPVWLELIPPLLLGFVIAYTAYNYALLPAMMPTHFGLTGMADGWSPKGFWSVYLPLVIGILVWLPMSLINYFYYQTGRSGKYMSMSQREKD